MRREFSSRWERSGREERECPYRGLLPLLPRHGFRHPIIRRRLWLKPQIGVGRIAQAYLAAFQTTIQSSLTRNQNGPAD